MTNTGTVIRPLERLLSISIRPLHTALVLTIVTVLPVLGGCSTNPATGEQSFTAFMSPEQERQVGQEQDPQIKKEFGGAYSDAELAAYVTQIGKKLAATSEMPNLDFKFTVLILPSGPTRISGLKPFELGAVKTEKRLSDEISAIMSLASKKKKKKKSNAALKATSC